MSNVTLAFEVGATLGEGALWDWRSDRLLSVDIPAGRVLISDPADGSTRELRVGQPVSAALLHGDDQLLLAVRDGVAFADGETGELGELVPVEADVPGNRMNDAACDARGRCFAGTMALDGRPGAGAPDGLTMDAEGGIWVAFWDGGAVRRFGPGGALEAVLELPAARPTKPAFGGADLARMYITSARLGDRAGAPGDLGGAILTLDPGVRGTRANSFGLR